jgi:hypothetical protein
LFLCEIPDIFAGVKLANIIEFSLPLTVTHLVSQTLAEHTVHSSIQQLSYGIRVFQKVGEFLFEMLDFFVEYVWC